ncbi:MAG: M28 family peptidase [Gemmatimonadota bacterium]|nr:M28 family peptidase [Gemmatimonadota bacterium]
MTTLGERLGGSAARRLVAGVVALVAAAAPLSAQVQDSLAITTDELGARLQFISSDLFEGRGPGSRGEVLTIHYLASELASFGVKPGAADSGWVQRVSIVVHAPDSSSPNAARVTGRVTRSLQHGRDLRFSNLTAQPEVTGGGELVFVGYGISAPVYGWDDFAGVDLRGKVAVFLLGEPRIAGDSTRFNGVRASRYGWLTDKLLEMERRGAVGALWLRPGARISAAPPSGARRMEADANGASLEFGGMITDSALAALLPSDAGTLPQLVARSSEPGFRAVPLGVRLDVAFRTRPRTVATNNVIGVVPGRDTALADEHVVLSAHWDAYGIGPAVNGDSIYNGALDDGSGMTALLALARVFAKHPQRRSITFLFTTAEEWGLLGAQAFVCAGPLPPERIAANLNVDDGIELMGEKRDAAPLGVELSSLRRNVSAVAERMGLKVSPDPYPEEGFFLRADNFPFARAGIPALYMGLGTEGVKHSKAQVDSAVAGYLQNHYHRPSDEYETVVLDLEGSRQFAEFIRDVTISIANETARPEWKRGAEFERGSANSACRR